MTYCFPFGQPLKTVQQIDRKPKKVFVLGVYASAVHARWIGPDGTNVVKALAVASEPYIFWRGENTEEIIGKISISGELGKLLPADAQLNGPSGVTLDEQFLKPLDLRREDAWLCDLVPHSCMNPAQCEAISRAYRPKMQQYSLPESTIPEVPRDLADERRAAEILDELRASQAGLLILLGDQPIKWLLWRFDKRWTNLADFGTEICSYGRPHRVQIEGMDIDVLPLAHPRQVARLGRSSERWFRLHEEWVARAGHD